jgi:tRNA(Ile)-lysidine synthase
MIINAVQDFVKNNPMDKYVIAYSGGVDSQVLLHAMSKVAPDKIIAFHVNHGISDNALEWETFCQSTAKALNIEFNVAHFNLYGETNLEEKARVARYGAFKSKMSDTSMLLTGHHMNDQVETFMLNLMRGAGVDGLSAMPSVKTFGEGYHGRPFLNVTKDDIKAYAIANKLQWVEDESNDDSTYDRNFIRNEVMPLMQTRWKKANEAIAQSVEHIQNAKGYIDTKVEELGMVTTTDQLNIEDLLMLNAYEQNETVRKWISFNLKKQASKNMMRAIFEDIIPASEDAKMKWEQKDYFVTRFNGVLHFVKKEVKTFDIQSILDSGNSQLKVNDVVVKYGCKGQKIKQGSIHKDVKKMFQEYKVPTWVREEIPYIYHNDELLTVGGYFWKK